MASGARADTDFQKKKGGGGGGGGVCSGKSMQDFTVVRGASVRPDMKSGVGEIAVCSWPITRGGGGGGGGGGGDFIYTLYEREDCSPLTPPPPPYPLRGHYS